MKIIFIFLFSCILYHTADGQIDWVYDNPTHHEFAYKMAKTKANQYAILYGYNSDFPGGVAVIDSIGKMQYEVSLDSFLGDFSIDLLTDVITMPDSTIAITADVNAVDPLSGLGTQFSAILKYNQLGELMQEIKVFNQFIDKAGALSDGSFIILDLDDSKISRKASNGSNVWINNLNGYSCHDMAIANTDSIIIATEQGLIVLDENGNIANENDAFVFDRIKTNAQGGIIGVREDSLFLVSPFYTLLAKIGYSGDDIEDVAVEGDRIIVLNESNFVYHYNGDLSLLSSFQLEDDAQFEFVASGPIGSVFSGVEQYGSDIALGDFTETFFLKEYSVDGEGYGISNDIGVVALQQEGEGTFEPIGSGYLVTFKNVKVTVQNYDDNPVDSLYLRSMQFNSQKYSNVSLLPDEQVELVMEELRLFFPNDPTGQTIDLCIWTSHPDSRLDYDASNDTHCADFLVNEDEVAAQVGMAVYPNPTAYLLNVQINVLTPLSNTTMRIVDADGRTMTNPIPFDAIHTFSIPVSDWAPGVYFLQIMEAGLIAKAIRFIVAR